VDQGETGSRPVALITERPDAPPRKLMKARAWGTWVPGHDRRGKGRRALQRIRQIADDVDALDGLQLAALLAPEGRLVAGQDLADRCGRDLVTLVPTAWAMPRCCSISFWM
jgi:hypothetical protein